MRCTLVPLILLALVALLALPGCTTTQPTDQEQASPTTVTQNIYVIAYKGATQTVTLGDKTVDASGDVAGEAAAASTSTNEPTTSVEAQASVPINPPTGGTP